jgi:hypothetical protein
VARVRRSEAADAVRRFAAAIPVTGEPGGECATATAPASPHVPMSLGQPTWLGDPPAVEADEPLARTVRRLAVGSKSLAVGRPLGSISLPEGSIQYRSAMTGRFANATPTWSWRLATGSASFRLPSQWAERIAARSAGRHARHGCGVRGDGYASKRRGRRLC